MFAMIGTIAVTVFDGCDMSDHYAHRCCPRCCSIGHDAGFIPQMLSFTFAS